MKILRRRLANEKRKLLQSEESSAGGVLARTTGRALPNQHSPMVAGWGLLCRHSIGVRIMINLLEVNSYAQIVLEKIAGEGDLSDYFTDTLKSLESKLSDRQAVLDKLLAKAEESGSDNSYNRYESVDEAYGYGLELKSLLEDYLSEYEDREGLEWQVADIVKSTGSELLYRLERAQW